MIPCQGVPLGIIGNSCVMPSTYSAFFTAALHGRERGSSDAIIYFLSDLLYARKHQTGLSYSNNITFSNAQFNRALSVGIVFYPMVNVDGVVWDEETDDCWRRNRNTDRASPKDSNKKDGNEDDGNWRDLFTFGVLGNSYSPGSEFYQGQYAFSESETRKIAWEFEFFPNLGWFMDIRTFGRHIFHPWGLDLNQVTKPDQNWRNETEVAECITAAMDKVADMAHTFGESAYLYPQTGGVMDWTYARHIVNKGTTKVMIFTMEMGDMESEAMSNLNEICPFYPTVEAFNISLREAAVGFIAFLLEVAQNTR
ncbi:hypothetical protein ACHAQA_004990 [Verticillium albo-atrum]